MNIVEKPVTEARAEFADLVNRVAYTKEPVVLTRRGKVMAALVSAEDLELLRELHAAGIDLTQAGSVAAEGEERSPQPSPLRLAAAYRPDRPPLPPGFHR